MTSSLGRALQVPSRLAQLNTPANIPLSYRAYALYHVDDPAGVERDIHELIDMIDDSLHARETLASGRVREREFFQITPEKAFMVFRKVAKLRGDSGSLELVGATVEEQEEEQIIKRRGRFSFAMLDIPVGAELSFIRDDSVACVVADDSNHVKYNGELTTLSALAGGLLNWSTEHGVQGPLYFTYDGEVLSDRRLRLEREAAGEE